jgi:chloramphenicol-sensitive protein RarD
VSSKLHSDPAAASLVQLGAIYAVLAYGAWGLLPIYWKLFGQIPAVEVLSHRMIWSMVFLILVLWLQRRLPELKQLWHQPKQVAMLLLTASLLSVNWGLYIYAVNSDRVVESSLGYFITPLVNVLLGAVFLKERLNWGQKLAVGLASLGVTLFVWQFGAVPWIALGLAVSFGLYGLLRKVVAVAPMVGLAVETLLLTPIALAFVGYWAAIGTGHFGIHHFDIHHFGIHFSNESWRTTLLFIGAGVVTSMPLLWFNNAAKRLRLSTLGFFQYIAPTIQLLLGLFVYHEPFTATHALTFGLIWSALAIYSATSIAAQRSKA